MATPDCMYCGSPTTLDDFEQVTGFRQRRSDGGPNQITLAEPTGKWACRFCIEKLKRGVAIEQESLL